MGERTMKKFIKRFRLFERILLPVKVLAPFYLFFSITAWNLNPGEWSFFARFLFALFFIIIVIFVEYKLEEESGITKLKL